MTGQMPLNEEQMAAQRNLLEAAYDFLNRHQWDGAASDFSACLSCGASKRHDGAHRPGCYLAELLGELNLAIAKENPQ